MQLSNDHISEFQLLYKHEFGEDISHEEAYEQGAALVRLIQLIYYPISQKEYVRVQREEKTILKRVNQIKQV